MVGECRVDAGETQLGLRVLYWYSGEVLILASQELPWEICQFTPEPGFGGRSRPGKLSYLALAELRRNQEPRLLARRRKANPLDIIVFGFPLEIRRGYVLARQPAWPQECVAE